MKRSQGAGLFVQVVIGSHGIQLFQFDGNVFIAVAGVVGRLGARHRPFEESQEAVTKFGGFGGVRREIHGRGIPLALKGILDIHSTGTGGFVHFKILPIQVGHHGADGLDAQSLHLQYDKSKIVLNDILTLLGQTVKHAKHHATNGGHQRILHAKPGDLIKLFKTQIARDNISPLFLTIVALARAGSGNLPKNKF